MGKFNRDDKKSDGGFSSRGGSSFGGNFRGGKSFGGGGGRFGGGRTTMHQAVCSECGNDCEIPFRPTNGRPVFCSNCFKKQGGGNDRPNKFAGERRERSNFEDRQMHGAVCAKCGNDCQVPFKPTIGKPVFCNECFKLGGNDNNGSGEMVAQIKLLNAKIDKLLTILDPNALIEKIEKPEIKKDILTKKTVKEKMEKTKTKVASKKAPAKKKK
jgi:CxxC-x17-CxxC domain-containing protein